MCPTSPAALRAPVQAALDDDPGADARADLDEDDVLVLARDARAQLAERHHVHVVVDPDGDVVVGEALAHRMAVSPA